MTATTAAGSEGGTAAVFAAPTAIDEIQAAGTPTANVHQDHNRWRDCVALVCHVRRRHDDIGGIFEGHDVRAGVRLVHATPREFFVCERTFLANPRNSPQNAKMRRGTEVCADV